MTTLAATTTENNEKIGCNGFDAPVSSRKDDHLNRWPLARKVYNVAVDGPAEWSARIGVYGEWGMGKTSVLRFVESMAIKDCHIVAWFDPWEYSNKSDLWQAFVLAISSAAKANLGEAVEVHGKKLKSTSGKVASFLGKLSKAVPLEGSSAVGEGLELLRSAFAFSRKDLDGLLEVLDGHRVIVVIDDLDRTEAELVPEILFALKQVMDIPGFSFICGFDPQVVGEALRAKHPGFGDGLKFLEKIIDYPVWLPPASDEGLKKIAQADAEKYCPFICPTALNDVIDLLPKNPRSIRQFVRLCALLKTQTERHGKDELNWPIILTSNVIKVRFPELDLNLLHSTDFYRRIGMRRTYTPSTQEGEKVDQEIGDHAEKCLKESNISDDSGEAKKWLQRAFRRICQHLELWMGEGVAGVIYQSNLSEHPKALTLKEFERMLLIWKNLKSAAALGSCIEKHADTQGFLKTEVANELAILLVAEMKKRLSAADAAFSKSDKKSNRTKAIKIQSFLEVLMLQPEKFDPALKVRDWLPVGHILFELVPLAEAKSPVHKEVWEKIQKTLKKLVSQWDASFERLLHAVRSIGPLGDSWIEGSSALATARKLNQYVDDQLSKHIINGIRIDGFFERIAFQRSGTNEMRKLIIKSRSQLWSKHSSALIAGFSISNPTFIAQRNAYAFLDWIKHLLENHDHNDDVVGKALANNNELMTALWQTATSKPFLGGHAHRLKDIPIKARELGVNLTVPAWWQPAIDEFLRSRNYESNEDPAEAPQ